MEEDTNLEEDSDLEDEEEFDDEKKDSLEEEDAYDSKVKQPNDEVKNLIDSGYKLYESIYEFQKIIMDRILDTIRQK